MKKKSLANDIKQYFFHFYLINKYIRNNILIYNKNITNTQINKVKSILNKCQF